ncbi:MAG: hybrid sensor histidine kinase/response regulator transcription factor [Cyclobacteriaceae bacterium]
MQAQLRAQSGYEIPTYRFEHFDTKDGLASDYSWSVAQDSLGYIWVQYFGGLSRYDGYNFKVYKHDPDNPESSLPGSEINWMYTDPSGDLWITPNAPTQHYVLSRYDRKTDGFIKYSLDLGGVSSRRLRFDKTGKTVWFSTPKGLFQFNADNLEVNNYLNVQKDSLSNQKANLTHDVLDGDSILLVGTAKGLWVFNKESKMFGRVKANAKDSAFFCTMPIIGIYQDQNLYDRPPYDLKELWLLFERDSTNELGLVKVDENFSIVQRFDFPGTLFGVRLMSLDRDKDGVFWISTWGIGICRYDPRDNSYVNLKKIPGDPYSLRSDFVMGIIVDRDQNIWAATHQGLSRLQSHSLSFYNTGKTGHMLRLSTLFKAGSREYLLIDDAKPYGDHEILIAPIVPGHLDSLKFQSAISSFRGPLLNGFWRGKRKFWISISAEGLLYVPINSATGMIENGPFQRLTNDIENPHTISSNITTSILEDANENLWVGTRTEGLNKIISTLPYGSKGSVLHYKHNKADSNSLSNNDVKYIFREDEKSVWVLTATGVDLLVDNRFQHVFKNKERPKHLHKTSDGNLLLATTGGLYEGINNGTAYVFRKLPVLNNSHITAINEDPLGRFWLSTLNGIVCYDRKENLAIEFNKKDGMEHFRTTDPSCMPYSASNGMMVVTGYDGYTLFDPLSLRINRARTLPVLTRLSVNNKVPLIESPSNKKEYYSISQDISVLNELVLDYQHNHFTLEFSAMELTAPEKNLYRYKLEGYDKDWIETDWKSRTATYTNLDPGTYIFSVKASNYHGIWSNNERTLAVVILPPPWRTWWAYTLYGLFFLGLILYWRSYEIKRVRLKQRAAYLSELDHVKTRFFANISHEFRTPITLILGPLREIYNQTTNPEQKTTFGVMIRNGQRLLRLINQLLDLSKIEAGKMQLHTTKLELVEFLREIAASYESLAAGKGIKYAFNPEVPRLVASLDKEKIEKVMHNILSNAFKFTKEGEVTMRLKLQDKQSALITVSDTGAGIPQDRLDKVFDRFYQVDSSHTRGYEASGLGMALAKELVELHHGKISVESTEGIGTTFTVWIPLGKEQTGIVENTDHRVYHETGETISEDHTLVNTSVSESVNGKPAASSEEHPVVLIVEDNADMRNYIHRTLFEHYHILEAANGIEGLKKAQEILPDLIISDIMMPEMDGYKLCELIKTNELTSHIPVILLTAKADRESKLAGLETGADDYLSKPFDGDELKLIIRNRVEERRKMRERFSREITLEPKQIAITSLDEKFLKKVLDIIEVHMDDENFSIVELSQEAGYSHIHFYRKIKALSGQTPSQFLRTIRLKRAADLLRNKSDNVSQIAYSVGFSSQSYFIKCFKEQFGMTPGQFVEASQRSKV